MPESSEGSEQNNKKGDAATEFPEIVFGLGGVDDAGKVHAIVGGEEREGKKNNRYNGEDEDSFVLAIGYDCQFVLFDRAQLEELEMSMSATEHS